jgi:hypothetical protein
VPYTSVHDDTDESLGVLVGSEDVRRLVFSKSIDEADRLVSYIRPLMCVAASLP